LPPIILLIGTNPVTQNCGIESSASRCPKDHYSTEQGIISTEQGIVFTEQGVLLAIIEIIAG
jgi:hypothetical protein